MRIDLERTQQPESYKAVVEKIKNLPWENLEGPELQKLMYLAWIAAQEFADALRIAVKFYAKDKKENPERYNQLQRMVAGELKTTNLVFDDYSARGDHSEFLKHFLGKIGSDGIGFVPDENLRKHGDDYLAACRSLPDEVRAMSVFSREEELSGIFARILQAPDWSAPGLAAYRHFMIRHIELDSEEGGHQELTSGFTVDDRVKEFYEARLKMYRAIPKLFESEVT